MGITNDIEQFIKEMIAQADDASVSLQRNSLASQLGCVPSQINYVLATRFTSGQGYIVESRRGGGGYIRITRSVMPHQDFLYHLIKNIGNKLTAQEAENYVKSCFENKLIGENEAKIILSAVSEQALSKIKSGRELIRADILKAMLLEIARR